MLGNCGDRDHGHSGVALVGAPPAMVDEAEDQCRQSDTRAVQGQALLSGGATRDASGKAMGGRLGVDMGATSGTDKSIATWVGRDMYIGERPSGKNLVLDGTTKPVGSYAAEVEGLTLVRGKFANNKLGNSWSNNGLRMGAVGFGSMFHPGTGSKALGVGGLDSNIASIRPVAPAAPRLRWEHGTMVRLWGAGHQ